MIPCPIRLSGAGSPCFGAPLAVALLYAGMSGTASAQMTPLLTQPAIPDGFDRGRNVSVIERPRPHYAPLGIRAGSFDVLPRIEIGAGATDNTYLADDGAKESSVFGYLAPSVRAQSDWSRHSLVASGGAQLRRFPGESRRNETAWNLGTTGHLEIGDAWGVYAQGGIARQVESPFGGDTTSELAVLSRYRRNTASLRGQYQAGRIRATVAVDWTGFDFSSIEREDGTSTDQGRRDRGVYRITGQYEYAFTPSISAFGQLSYDDTVYDQDFAPGIANQDSKGTRALAGANFDISGFVRGSLGIGYGWRRYDSPLYDDVDGVSVQGKIEYFPSELTTFQLTMRRTIEDSSIFSVNAFFDNRAALRVDHELLRNLILNATVEVSKIDFIGSSQNTDTVRFLLGGRYMPSRSVWIDATATYGVSDGAGATFNQDFKELRGQISATFQR